MTGKRHQMTLKNKTTGDGRGGIVLFAKRPGVTSFSSLFTIKHAFNTSKAGHTGTLDSFASGLLVVCIGPLTRLASRITEFDKSYDAVIEFGRETDTLECTGNTVRTAPLPEKNAVAAAVAGVTGKSMQIPPLFSALHINGERASCIARSGREADIPARPVTVFSAGVEEYLADSAGGIKAVRVRFSVSKGTYIRSLARDIGKKCGSAAHLAGLRRLSVGGFRLEDAAGTSLLAPFTIEEVYKQLALQVPDKTAGTGGKKEHAAYVPDETELLLREEVREKLKPMTESLAVECGFEILHLKKGFEQSFRNGRSLEKRMFENEYAAEKDGCPAAVFSFEKREFLGMITVKNDGRYSYLFVIYAETP